MSRGFTIVELLVAMMVTLLIAGAIAGIAQPARAAFDRVPAELDLQQRGRIAIDAVAQALRAALPIPGERGRFDELTVVMRLPAAASGRLSVDQPDPGASLTLAVEQCPNLSDVCGFTSEDWALLVDPGGVLDVFSIAAVDVVQHSVTPATTLAQAYPAGAAILQVEQLTFRLAEQPDGSYSLIRATAAGAIQPIVDGVSELSFDVVGSDLGAGLVQPEQVDVRILIEPLTESLRRVIDARVFRTSIRLRSAS